MRKQHRIAPPALPAKRPRCPRRRRGSTIIATMIFLALFATLSVAFIAAADMNLRVAHNYGTTQDAQLAAESGMAYLLTQMRTFEISEADATSNLLLAVANRTAARMDDTANLGEAEITFDGTTLRIPTIPLQADGQTFSAEMVAVGVDQVALVVTGSARGQSRRVQMLLAGRPGGGGEGEDASGLFGYGIATRGKVILNGNARVRSANAAHPEWADVVAGTYSDPQAVSITGNCTLDGDISTSNPDSTVSIIGNPNIGGTSDPDEIFSEHVHIGVGPLELPEVDPTVFEPYATNTVNRQTNTNGNRTFENIRIAAGTNPTFSGNITIRGVVYVEQPNRVTFSGNLNMTGVIVTEDAGDGNHDSNYLDFAGNVSFQGVESLPNQPQFSALRQKPGSAILAPGFGLTFRGNFGVVNGAMAADAYTLVGNAGGTVYGPVFCYSDTPFSLVGNSNITIDHSRNGAGGEYGETLPGFVGFWGLTVLPGTYQELHQ